MKFTASALLVCCVAAAGADYKAGVGRADITPSGPIWLSGYASRAKPSEGVLQRLWAKALAIEDKKGNRLVVVTTDLIGLPRHITDVVGARVEKEYGLERARLLLNSSHTHTGPVVGTNLRSMFDLPPAEDATIKEYAGKLTDQLVVVIGAALGALKPADLAFGTGQVGFAANRRQHTPEGVKLGVNPNGPVDHSVPVLRVTAGGRVIAVLFGYACHNTTLTGEHYKLSGDYAGAAQKFVEETEPGATALFMELCGGDQNPSPRSEERHVEQHGKTLATEVSRVMRTKLAPVKGDTQAAMQWPEFALQPHSRGDFEAMLKDKSIHKVRLAQATLKTYDERRPVRNVTIPVQALRLGKDLAIVGIGGEVVVDYALKTKAAFPKMNLIVAGYSNEVAFYVPTAKMLEEGGYEPVMSMIYYGIPAPFAPEVEERLHSAIRQVLARVGVR